MSDLSCYLCLPGGDGADASEVAYHDAIYVTI